MSRGPRLIGCLLLALASSCLHSSCRPPVTLPGATTHLSDRVAMAPTKNGNLVLLRNQEGEAWIDTRVVPSRDHASFAPLHSEATPAFLIPCHGNTEPIDGASSKLLGADKIMLYSKGKVLGGNDRLVYLPKDQVLILGSLVATGKHAPAATELPNGAPHRLRAWPRLLRKLAKDFASATSLQVIPTMGPAADSSCLIRNAEFLEQLLSRMDRAHRHGLNEAEAMEEVLHMHKHFPTVDRSELLAAARRVYDWVGSGR